MESEEENKIRRAMGLEELDDETKEAINDYNALMNSFKKIYRDSMECNY